MNAGSEERLNILREKNGELKLTSDQKSAVLDDGELLVSAAAGSGKTSTMIKRIILKIAEGMHLRDMLILVYNEAAAMDLKKRLHVKLFDMACSTRGEISERFRAELDDMPFCHIGTIHSFCQSLIRDNFEKLELSPTYEVLDENKNNVYKNRAVTELLERRSEQGDEAFEDLAEIFAQARKEDNLKEKIIKLNDIIDIQPDRSAFTQTLAACYGGNFEDSYFLTVLEEQFRDSLGDTLNKFPIVAERISILIESAAQLGMEQPEVNMLKEYLGAVKYVAQRCKDVLAATDFKSLSGAAASYEPPALKKRPSKASLTPEGLAASDDAKACLDAVKTTCADFGKYFTDWDWYTKQHAQNAVYVNKLVELTLEFEDILKKMKKHDSVMSFEDLLHGAAELLTDHPELGGKFKAVYVDEYQDVNPTQEYIISKLINGDCFMVGDVKQSIYGFRLADPTIFLSRQARYESAGEGKAISFNSNFRSEKGILKFVNDVFDTVMTVRSADVDYKGAARFTINETDGIKSDDKRVQVKLFMGKSAATKDAEGLYDITAVEEAEEDVVASECEGEYIADEINSLVGRLIVKDEDGERYAGYNDFVVLFRSHSRGARQIIATLREAGIPVSEGSFGNGESAAEREMINFLKVIDNGRQDIPLAGFLLSPFGDFDEQELAYVASFEAECLYDKLRYAAALAQTQASEDDAEARINKKCARVLNMLSTYRTKASFKSVSELMNGIVSDFSYDAILMQRGESNVYALRSFISSAASFDESLGKFLEEYAEQNGTASVNGGGNRVRVSTFHGFKGLEAPVVFVADVASKFNTQSATGDLLLSGKGHIGLKYFDMDAKHKYDTASVAAVRQIIRLNQVKEEMRLMYVALTRAQQLMYVTASVSTSSGQNFGKSIKGLRAGCDLDFISDAVCAGTLDIAVTPEEATARERVAAAKPSPGDPFVIRAIKQARNFVYPYKTSTDLPMKCSVSSVITDEESVRVYDERAALGTLYHRVMQNIDFFAEGYDGVRAELCRMMDEQIISEEEMSKLDPVCIVRCLESEIGSLVREATLNGRCLREQPFLMYKPASEVSDAFLSSDKVLVQGVVDLFIDGKQRVIVDFKNSYLRDEEVLNKYRKQLYLYKNAIESAISAKIDRVLLYSLKTGAIIEV